MDGINSEYDYDSTIFSPDGRLFQVEYARETIKRGATTIGLKYENGILILTHTKTSSKLIEFSSTDKIFQIDKNIICSYVGLSADARQLIDYACEIAASHKIWYDEPITVKELVEEICEYKHIFTTYNGLRPFGLVLIIAGIDERELQLYRTDPSGSFLSCKVICEGEKSDNIIKYFEKEYSEKITKLRAIKLAIDSVKKSIKKKIDIQNFNIGIIEKNKPFFKLNNKEIEKII